MAIKLASLGVELTLNAAQFVTGFEASKRELKNFSRDVSSSLSEVGNIASQALGQLGTVGSEVGATLSSVAASATSAYSGFSRLSSPIAGVVAGLGAVGIAGGGALVALAVHAAESAAKIGELSQATGVSVVTLSRYEGAAKASGLELDGFAKGLERMDRSLIAAITSGNSANTSWGRLGFSLSDLKGFSNDSGKALEALADKFAAMPDGPQKTAAAIGIFGRAGAEMIALLNRGSAGLKDFADFADAAGATLDGKAVMAAEHFKETMAKLEIVETAAGRQLMIGVIPALDRLTEAFASAVKGGTTFETLGRGLGNVLVDLAEFGASASGMFERLGLAASLIKGDIGWKQFREELEKSKYEFDQFELGLRGSAFYNQGLNLDPFTGQKAGSNSGFAMLDRLKQQLNTGKGGSFFDLTAASGAAAAEDVLEKLRGLERETDAVLDRKASKQEQEIVKISELITKWQDYGTAFTAAHGGISAAANAAIEALASERAALQANEDELRKMLSMGLVPGAKTPLPDSLTKATMPEASRHTRDLAEILKNGDAAADAADRVKAAIGEETKKLQEQIDVLVLLREQGRLTAAEFTRAMQQAAAAQADINARNGGAIAGAKAAVYDLAATWESQGSIIRRTMTETFRGIEDNLAEMIVTGKARWSDFLKELEVSFVKSEIHKGLATIAGGIASKLHIPGVEEMLKGKPDGTDTDPLHVIVKNMPGAIAGSAAGGATGDIFGGQGGGGLFGGLLGKIFGGGKSSTPITDVLDQVDQGNDTGGTSSASDNSGVFKALESFFVGKDGGGFFAGGFLKTLQGLFGGGRADGGDMEPGKWYITGEKHPEIIAPKRPMSVYAHPSQMTGTYGDGKTVNNFSFHGVTDMDTFKASQGQIRRHFLESAYMAHQRNK